MFQDNTIRLDREAGFLATAIGKNLAETPLRIIDIGARDGIHDMFHPLGKLASILAFEPDPQGYAELIAQRALLEKFAEVTIRQEAVGDGRNLPFYVLSKPTNNSLLPPNAALAERYKMNFFKYVSDGSIDTRRLDDIVAEPDGTLAGFGEIIKIDTQGSEHLIFNHAENVLKNNTIAVIAEVWFCEIYEKQPLFHDLCRLLESFGLTFYGFTNQFLRSGKRLDKRRSLGRERMLYADAVFLKDPFDNPGRTPSGRHISALFAFAALAGYFDLALEIAETQGADFAAIADLVNRMARADDAAIHKLAADALKQASANPERANVILGKYADHWRNLYDFGDQA